MKSAKKQFCPPHVLALVGLSAVCSAPACSDASSELLATGGQGTAGNFAAGNGGQSDRAGGPTRADAGAAGNSSEAGSAGSEDAAGAAGATLTSPDFSAAGAAGSAGEGAGTAGAGGDAPVVHCIRDQSAGKLLALSESGNDGLFALSYGPDGSLYAAGYTQDGIANTEDRATIVVKLSPTGVIDKSWANQGVSRVNVVATAAGIPGQAELPRGIAFQGSKIVVAGTVEASATEVAPLGNDRNVYVLRLNADGSLDTTFGDNASGIHFLPLNSGVLVTNPTSGVSSLSGADAQWGLNVLQSGELIVTAATRATGFQSDGTTPRSDTDFAVVKLTESGKQQTAFGTSGIFTLDVAQANASVRTATVLADGKLIVTGYSSFAGTQRPVIFQLTGEGALDTSFGVQGVFSEPVGAAAEAYGAVLQSTGKLVTVGYGRASATTPSSDLLSIRLTKTGLLDTTYGTAAGRTWFDVGGFGDNGRTLQVLSDDRVVLIGGGRLTESDQDGVVAILDADGKPDTATFGPFGCRAFDFGTSGDFLWGSAVSPDGNTIAAVGTTGNAAGSTLDTDGTLVLIAKP